MFKSIEIYEVDTTAGKTITGPGIINVVYERINSSLDYKPYINIDGLNDLLPNIGNNYLFKNSVKIYTTKAGYGCKAIVALFND